MLFRSHFDFLNKRLQNQTEVSLKRGMNAAEIKVLMKFIVDTDNPLQGLFFGYPEGAVRLYIGKAEERFNGGFELSGLIDRVTGKSKLLTPFAGFITSEETLDESIDASLRAWEGWYRVTHVLESVDRLGHVISEHAIDGEELGKDAVETRVPVSAVTGLSGSPRASASGKRQTASFDLLDKVNASQWLGGEDSLMMRALGIKGEIRLTSDEFKSRSATIMRLNQFKEENNLNEKKDVVLVYYFGPSQAGGTDRVMRMVAGTIEKLKERAESISTYSACNFETDSGPFLFEHTIALEPTEKTIEIVVRYVAENMRNGAAIEQWSRARKAILNEHFKDYDLISNAVNLYPMIEFDRLYGGDLDFKEKDEFYESITPSLMSLNDFL